MCDFKQNTLQELLAHIGSHQWHWIVKRLSGNDTGITGGHQSGVYLPKAFIQEVFPQVNRIDSENPSLKVPCIFPL